VAFSSDGRLLLCGDQVFESETGLPVTPPTADTSRASVFARFIADDGTVFTGVNGVARLRSLRSEQTVESLLSLARLATGRRIDDGGGLRRLTLRWTEGGSA
jgi:glyoxylase-like metal-dependent hydrolase (beta-lactamase superfamily II)